jgi:hypothetical protein
MAEMFRPYSAGDVMGRFSGEEILGGSARTGAENGQRFIELRAANSGKWTRYRVDALIGSKWEQAYASKLPDGRLVVLPIQYSKVEGGWVNYWKIVDGSSERSDIGHFQGTPDGALYQRDCAPCHTSQLRYGGAGASPATAQFRVRVVPQSPPRTMRPGIRNPSNSRPIPMRCAYSATNRCAIVPSGIRGTRRRAKPAAAFRATCRAIWMRCCSAPDLTKSTKFPMLK